MAAYTNERPGHHTTTAGPAFHRLTSFIDRINKMEQLIDISSQEIITRDRRVVVVDGAVFFQALAASRAVYKMTDLTKRRYS